MKTELIENDTLLRLDIFPELTLPESADHYDKHIIEAIVYKTDSQWKDYKKGEIKIQLTHQCNEWEIGDINNVDILIDALIFARKWCKKTKTEMNL